MSIFRSDLFDGKVAIVTGGGTGICKGITQALAEHGAHTVITSRKMENLEPTAKEIAEKSGRKCLPIVADVRQPDQVDAMVQRTVEELGSVDVLINGAAGNFLCPAATLSPNGFGTVLDIDTKGTWHCCRAVYNSWMAEHGGNILNVSATLHYGGTPLQLHVSAAKAAIDALTRNLAVEWGPVGIRVVGVAPGAIEGTEGAKRLLPADFADKLRDATPIRRLGQLSDIANICLFLLSDAASNITGVTVVSDGGSCLAGSFGLSIQEAMTQMGG